MPTKTTIVTDFGSAGTHNMRIGCASFIVALASRFNAPSKTRISIHNSYLLELGILFKLLWGEK